MFKRQAYVSQTPVSRAHHSPNVSIFPQRQVGCYTKAAAPVDTTPLVLSVPGNTTMLMGDYMDLAADLYGLPRPRRVDRLQAPSELTLMALSFMGESRRLVNHRLKTELRLALRYPHVSQGLLADGGRSRRGL